MSYDIENYYCSCLTLRAPTCHSTYRFQVQLAGYTGNFFITDKHGKVHVITADVDIDGYVDLDASVLPEGLLNAYSKVKVEFWMDIYTRDYFISGNNYFPCLYLDFYNAFQYNTYNIDLSVINQQPFICCCASKSINCDNYEEEEYGQE